METFERLKKYAQMKTQEDIQHFEQGIWEQAQTQDPEKLRQLIDLFDDACPYYEVMYSLVHAVETYSDEIYVPIVMEKAQEGVKKYPFWIYTLIVAIWNTPNGLKLFKENIHKIKKDSLATLFNLIESESLHHHELIAELRQKLEKHS